MMMMAKMTVNHCSCYCHCCQLNETVQHHTSFCSRRSSPDLVSQWYSDCLELLFPLLVPAPIKYRSLCARSCFSNNFSDFRCCKQRTPFFYSYKYHYLILLCVPKSIPDIFGCNLKTNYQIVIIFGTHIHDTPCHQTTVQFPTSSNVCFCTT